MPGEVSQEIGRAYVYTFGGCLERAIKGFSQTFNVYTNPDKLGFNSFTGAAYSFDLAGIYEDAEVFVESKGHRDGTAILDGYKEFLAKAYCTATLSKRHRRDHFWFITNVPFGSSIGRRLWSSAFITESLRDQKPDAAAAILGGAPIDDGHVQSLSQRIAVGIFTDSFIKVMGTQYRFAPGDTLWSVTKLIHGGKIPLPQFQPIAIQVQLMNELKNPDRIRSGQRVRMPWYGIHHTDEV